MVLKDILLHWRFIQKHAFEVLMVSFPLPYIGQKSLGVISKSYA